MYFPHRPDAGALDWAAAESAHGIARGRSSAFPPGELAITQALLHALLSRHPPQVVACCDEQFLHPSTWMAPAHTPFPFAGPGGSAATFRRSAMHVLSQAEEALLGADWLVVLVEPGGRRWRAILVQAKIMKETTKTLAPAYDALDVAQTKALIAAEVHARSSSGWPLYAMYAFYNFMPWDCPQHDPRSTYGYRTACTTVRPAASFGVTLVPARDLLRLSTTPRGEYDATAKRGAGDAARPFSCALECMCLGRAGLAALDHLAREGVAAPVPELGLADVGLPAELDRVLAGEGDSAALERLLAQALGAPVGTEPPALPIAGVLVAELSGDLANEPEES